MSKAQHTPGPWYANGNGIHIRRGTVGLCVATAHDPNEPNLSNDVCHANARLIAAAPDLLAACKALIEETHSRGRGGGDTLYLARAQAIEAIAKAQESP